MRFPFCQELSWIQIVFLRRLFLRSKETLYLYSLLSVQSSFVQKLENDISRFFFFDLRKRISMNILVAGLQSQDLLI